MLNFLETLDDYLILNLKRKMAEIKQKKAEKSKTYWIVREAIKDEMGECQRNDGYKIPFFVLISLVIFIFTIVGIS